jgi:hypothetical protein
VQIASTIRWMTRKRKSSFSVKVIDSMRAAPQAEG